MKNELNIDFSLKQYPWDEPIYSCVCFSWVEALLKPFLLIKSEVRTLYFS